MQTSAVDLNTMLVRSPELVQCEIDGDVTMMSVESGKYYTLRAVGARVWSMLAEPIQLRVVCDQLMSAYVVERDRCESDVLRLAQRMLQEQIVMLVPTPHAEDRQHA